MPSNKELQRELIKKNDHILRLSATNSELRTSNAKLALENDKIKIKPGIHHSRYIKEYDVTIQCEDGTFLYHSLEGLVTSYLNFIKDNAQLRKNEKKYLKIDSENKDLRSLNYQLTLENEELNKRNHTLQCHRDAVINENNKTRQRISLQADSVIDLQVSNTELRSKINNLETLNFKLTLENEDLKIANHYKSKSKQNIDTIRVSMKLTDKTICSASIDELVKLYTDAHEDNLKLKRFINQTISENIADSIINKIYPSQESIEIDKLRKENEQLRTDLDGYIGLSTQLYELATKDKGHF